MILLRDREEIGTEALMLTPLAMMIASLLDGRHTAAHIQDFFKREAHLVLKAEEIEALVARLSQALLLATPEAAAKELRIRRAFRNAATRPAKYAGGGYPAERFPLSAFLDAFFKDPKGPVRTRVAASTPKKPALGLFCPHIDFNRGGPAYAWAYGALAESPKPDLILGLGVAHMSPNSPWVLTPKDYETPYGPMKTDPALYAEINDALWYDGRDDEEIHKGEHSLEFQAVWLKHLWKDGAPPWVPILCSSLERYAPEKPPTGVERIEQTIEKIGAVLRKRSQKGQTILVLAGIDLAHVGPRFGDQIELNKGTEQRVEVEDRKSLEFAMTLDANGFYRSVVADDHWRKVCGLSAGYAALRWMKAMAGESSVNGQLLTYGQAPDPMGGLVSFASVIYERP